MPIFTDSPTEGRRRTLDSFETDFSSVMGAIGGFAADTSPVTAISRMIEYEGVEYWGMDSPDEAESKRLSQSEAQERVRERGFDIEIPQWGLREKTLDILFERHQKERDRDSVIGRGEGGVAQVVGGFMVGLGVSMLDPINLASAFIPVYGPAKYAQMLRRASTAAQRAAVRARVGLVEGAVGATLIEPLPLLAAAQDQTRYGPLDSLMNITFGSILGGGLHTFGGHVYDKVRPFMDDASWRNRQTMIRGNPRLSPKYKEIEQSFADDVADVGAAWDRYKKMPATDGGRVITPELVARMSPEVRETPALADVVREPAVHTAQLFEVLRREESAGVPPPADGMVRMYHGGESGPEGGQQFTSSRADAEGAARDGDVWYVDVPADHPAVTPANQGAEQTFSAELPENIAKNRQRLPRSEPEAAPEAATPKPQETAAPHKVPAEFELEKPPRAREQAATEQPGRLRTTLPPDFELDPPSTARQRVADATPAQREMALRTAVDQATRDQAVDVNHVFDGGTRPAERQPPQSEESAKADDDLKAEPDDDEAALAAQIEALEQQSRPAEPEAKEPPKPAEPRELSPSAMDKLRGLFTGNRIDAQPPPEGWDADALQPTPGARTETVFDARDRPIEVEWEVVDIEALVTSDRPGFPPELQPRDRAREGNQRMVRKIVKEFAAARLGASKEADRGAPIVGPGMLVESGNGRVTALREVFRSHPDKAAAYRAFLVEQGFPAAADMQTPALIRKRLTPLDPADRQGFVTDANLPATAEFSAQEQAMVDVQYLTPSVFRQLKSSQLLNAENAGFVRAFLGEVPESRHGLYLLDNGSLSEPGRLRIENAILARAYGGTDASNLALRRMTESPDNNVRAITKAMVTVAPRWLELREDVASGEVPVMFDITAALVKAVETISMARAKRNGINDVLAQVDIFADQDAQISSDLIRMFYNRKADGSIGTARGQEKIAESLDTYLTNALGERTNQAALFDVETVTPQQLLTASRQADMLETDQLIETADDYGKALEVGAECFKGQ